jgi:Tfp pilus assembly protein PilF
LNKGKISNQDYFFNANINYYFLKNDFNAIMDMVTQKGIQFVLDSLLNKMEYSNYDAWTSYRIGQAYENTGNMLIAGYFYEKAIVLAKYILDFQNKYGTYLVKSGKLNEAFHVFEFIISEDPRFVSAYVNYGYSLMVAGHMEKAKENYQQALQLDPDHIQALTNLAGLNIAAKNRAEGTRLIDRVLKLDPENRQALAMKARLLQN